MADDVLLPEQAWPALPLAAWAGTRDTVHMYTQVLGKIRLALTPLEREWANVPLYLTARGLTTSAIPYRERAFQLDLDCVSHTLEIAVSDGRTRSLPLIPALSVADFYLRVMTALHGLGIEVRIRPLPAEVKDAIPLDQDRSHASYDPEYVQRFWSILVAIGAVFAEHRAPFRGRHTAVQFFWGTFDLAYVRFSGRPAQPPPNADVIMRVAMDAEEISAGFWPGDERFPEPAFFSYAYPRPPKLEGAALRPAGAFWNEALGLFMLRYDDVRSAPSPRAALRAFLTSTYEAGATFGGWDRAELDGSTGPE